ncbi:MAG: CorA family divalent cation transporter, partial [Nitrospiria bacterium]
MQRLFCRYNNGNVEERADLADLSALLRDPNAYLWVDLEGEPPEVVEAVSQQFSLHPVTIEDLLHGSQRPKIEEFDGYIFVVVHGLKPVPDEEVPTDEFHIVLGKNW